MELGLSYLFPVITPNTWAVAIQSAGREERWERVLIAAAKQCRRDTLLTIAPPNGLCRLVSHDRDISDAGHGPYWRAATIVENFAAAT